MNRRTFSAALTVGSLLLAVGVGGQATNKPLATTASSSTQTDYALPDITAEKWTGDLDGMLGRRRIRVLVPYSKTFFFVDRGTKRGLAYDAGRLLEDDLNKKLKKGHLRVHVVLIPVARDEFIPSLLEGRGDIAIANLSITPERLKQVDFAGPTGRNIKEIAVTGPGAPSIKSLVDLSGKEIYVRRSSSFYESLQKVNAEFAKAGKTPVKIRLAPENLEIEDILEMVNAGLVKITIADDHMAGFWEQIFTRIVLHQEVAVRTGGELGWMIRKNSRKLKAELNAFLARYPERSARRNILINKYLKSTKYVKEATAEDEIAKFDRTIEFFRKYGARYGMDYLLMMAQGYQESRLDQDVKSPVGAVGVMQVMPATGKQMGVGDITQMEANIHAGVKYMRFMMNQYYRNEPMDSLNKGLFTFASYNAGPGRIAQLRKLAAQRGLDPNVWFNNVELIAAEKIGRETVTYVSNIYKYYLTYRLVAEQREERAKSLEAIKQEGAK